MRQRYPPHPTKETEALPLLISNFCSPTGLGTPPLCRSNATLILEAKGAAITPRASENQTRCRNADSEKEYQRSEGLVREEGVEWKSFHRKGWRYGLVTKDRQEIGEKISVWSWESGSCSYFDRFNFSVCDIFSTFDPFQLVF
jgi:hypothetical protein